MQTNKFYSKNVENRTPDVSKLVTNTTFNTKVGEVKIKIPNFVD